MNLLKYKKQLTLLTSLVALLIIPIFILFQQITFNVPVFGFHGITDQKEPEKFPSRAAYLDYSIQNLETLLRKLIEENYCFLSSQELYEYFISKSQPIPLDYQNKKPIVLTFDDGYKSLNIYLIPLLEKLKDEYNTSLKVVLFINPKFMAEKGSKGKVKYLDCNDLKQGMISGFYDIQSHGLSHRILTGLNEKILSKELIESQKILQECTANLPDSNGVALHFAYPYNRFNREVITKTAKFYLSGYGYSSRLRQFAFMTNKMIIPRIGVFYKDSPEKLLNIANRIN